MTGVQTCALPISEENSDSAASSARYSARKDEETSKGLAWWVHLVQYTELDDKHEAHEREGIETNQEK